MTDLSFDFVGKNVLVIGSSRGIGKEVSKQFMATGAHVSAASRTNPEISGLNFIECDISNPQEIEDLFLGFNKLDFVINVAGTNLCEPIEVINSTEWDRVLNTNLKSFFLICKHAIAMMRTTGGGRIVNVSSIAGRSKSIVSGVHYTASKYGIIGLTKQLSHEVAKDNILVNCVCPSQTMTEMLRESMTKEQIMTLQEKIPIQRIATTTEQALPILFLCSSGASYISGAAIDINGGQL